MTATNHAGTPLSRYGRNVPVVTVPVTPARTARRTATVTATAPATPVNPVVPAPTVRTMIVCVPDELPGEVFDRRLLDRHFGVQGSIAVRFWAKPCNPTRRRSLVDARKGKPTACAGGPVRLLDLPALRQASAVAPAVRYQTWATLTRGSRDARPWVSFL